MSPGLAAISKTDIAVLRRAMPRAFGASLAARLGLAVGWVACAALITVCLWRLDAAPQRLWQGLGKLGWLVPLMVPPTHGGWLGEFSYAMLETLAMAFLGTCFASLAAVPLGFLGAKNVVPQVLWHCGLRRCCDSIRGIDALVWALMCTNVVGLGLFAGMGNGNCDSLTTHSHPRRRSFVEPRYTGVAKLRERQHKSTRPSQIWHWEVPQTRGKHAMSITAPQWTGEKAKFVDDLFAWLSVAGATHYEEQVTQLQHALQTAELARQEHATEQDIVAALLHDIGHLLVDAHQSQDDFLGRDLQHEEVGAQWLAPFFPAEVIEPVRLHVLAKRWLCTMDETYWQGLSEASRHSFLLQGEILRQHRAHVGMIYQQFNLVRRLRVLDNVLIGRLPHLSGMSWWFALGHYFSSDDRHVALRCLEHVGLLSRAWQRTDTLSGGEQQRVAIAKVLAQEPHVILADEPVASLDLMNSTLVMDTLRRIVSATGLTVIATLHHVEYARRYADRVLGLRAGALVFDGPPSALTDTTLHSLFGTSLPLYALPEPAVAHGIARVESWSESL